MYCCVLIEIRVGAADVLLGMQVDVLIYSVAFDDFIPGSDSDRVRHRVVNLSDEIAAGALQSLALNTVKGG